MQDHLFHISFTAIPFLALLILFLKKTNFSLRINAYLGLTLILFVLFHFSPFSMAFAFHHQSADATSTHPCCIPQVSEATAVFFLIIVFFFFRGKPIDSPTAITPVFTFYHNPRSPPVHI